MISFSGGETSAYMTRWLLTTQRSAWDEIVVVFANTGEEREETLDFVHKCDIHFGFNTVWIEGVQYPGERKSAGFKIVDYATASRDGTPFEESIAKYGIPNQKFKDCTRNLKRRPMEAYLRSLGWEDYTVAIGIRVDEIDRMSSDASRKLFYPLCTVHPMTKPKINSWFSKQPFRLDLKGYQGNCKWCWKKSDRKHFTLFAEDPSIYVFPWKMEQKYGRHGPEFRHDPTTRRDPLPDTYRRTFFRGNRSVEDLYAAYEKIKNTFIPATDDAQIFDPELDVGGGCEESCEVYADEDEISNRRGQDEDCTLR